MFGKLFKYDFKSNYKWYCITFAILLSLSILMGFITGSSLRPEVMERYSDYPMATSGVIFTLYLLFLLLFSASCAVFLSNTIIIMTSNLGATALRDDKTVGFGARDIRLDHANMEKRMLEELKKAYRPEFINRIDEKVVFHSLSAEDMQEVVKVMVKPLIASLAEKGIELKFQASALKLLAQEGYDVEMGARPLRRTLQTQVEDKLSELLLTGDLTTGQTLKVGVKAGQLKFEVA